MTSPNNIKQTNGRRLTIRISSNSLSFSAIDTSTAEAKIQYEPYEIKNGISMAANLREAMKTASLPKEHFRRALVMIDSNVLIIPIDIFREGSYKALYTHSFPKSDNDEIMYTVLPYLNAVAAFSVNKDLKLVIDDNFGFATFVAAMSPVWKYLHQRSFTGTRNKLYGYFHDNKIEVFCFTQNRFKFCNTFNTARPQDAIYFLLYVWKQMMLKPEYDEMHIVGEIPDREWMLEELRRYLQRAYIINPAGDFNRAPATQIKGMPYDLMTLYIKGR